MRDIEQIKARLEALPCVIDPAWTLETCCASGLEGKGIMDKFGHRIADTVLDPYAEFFVNVPEDMRRLIARVERLEASLRDISPQKGEGIYPASACWIVARSALAEEDEE